MFTNKDKPELYELLKMNRSKLGKSSAQENEEKAASSPVTAPSDSEPIPYTNQQSGTAKVYPKLRIPFPTLKPKETANVFQKSKPAQPKIKTAGPGLNYPKIIVIVGIIIAAVFILYMALSTPKSGSENPAVITPPPATRTTETPQPPATTGRFWAIRLIYYNNNDEGHGLVQNRIKFLNGKGISGVFTRDETIGGSPCTAIYKGKYASKEEAKKDLPHLKKIHYAFKNADAVEVK